MGLSRRYAPCPISRAEILLPAVHSLPLFFAYAPVVAEGGLCVFAIGYPRESAVSSRREESVVVRMRPDMI